MDLNNAAKNGIKNIKKMVIGIIGLFVILAGIAMLVLPGPGIAVILLGLAILASEFAYARLILRKMKAWVKEKYRKKIKHCLDD